MKRAWPKNNFSPQSWVRNFFLVKLETLYYQLVKKSDPPNGVLGQALFWRKCLVLIVRGIVHYGQNMFRMSRSNLNILSRGSKVSNLRKDFFSERVINHWNGLPTNEKLSTSVDTFKVNLEVYKQRSIKDSLDGNDGKFWEVSEHVLNRIETPSYLAGRPAFSQYLEDNPWSARRKGINIFRSQQ